MLQSWSALWVVVLVGVIGCGDDGSDPTPGGGKTTREVGPEGGTVELAEGGKVEIPRGALNRSTSITIEEVTDPEPFADAQYIQAAGKAYAFKPHGLQFAMPITLELPFDDNGEATEVRLLKLEDEQDTTWQTQVDDTKEGNKIRLTTSSFSIYRPARPRRVTGVIVLEDGAVIFDSDAMAMPDATVVRDGGAMMFDGGGNGGYAFVDPVIESYVRTQLNRQNGPIMEAELGAIDTIDIPDMLVTRFDDFEHFSNLFVVRLGLCNADLSQLSNAVTLMRLELSGNFTVTGDLSDLAGLPNLNVLHLSGTSVTGDLSSLIGVGRIADLRISGTQITGDLFDLSTHTMLAFLSAENTAITGNLSDLMRQTDWLLLELDDTGVVGDLAAISGTGLSSLTMPPAVTGTMDDLGRLNSLENLDVGGCAITGNIVTLAGHARLRTIELGGTAVTGTLLGFSTLPMLTDISLYNTSVSGDISNLASATGLERIYVPGTSISGDIATLTNFPLLNYAGFSQTAVSGNLSSLSGLTALQVVEFNNTDVLGDLASLSGLPAVTIIGLEGMGLTGDLSDLSPLTTLQVLNLHATPVTGTFDALLPLLDLEFANLSGTAITMDLSPLAMSFGTRRLMTLQLVNNAVDCIAQDANIQTLRGAGCMLTLDCP